MPDDERLYLYGPWFKQADGTFGNTPMSKTVDLPIPRTAAERMAKKRPFVVERHDQEDGSIHYEIWDTRQASYRRLCTVTEDPVEYEEPSEDRGRAKKDADLIVRSLNFMHGDYLP